MYFCSMGLLKKILDFYLDSSIHVALAVFAFSWITLIEFNVPFDNVILYFIFYASIIGYNFVKYFGLTKFHYRSLATWLKVIQLFSLICFILMCYYAFQLESKTLLFIVAFGIVTFLYAIPFLPSKMIYDSNKNLRNISGLKVYIIALVWAGVTVLLPLLNNNHPINTDVILTVIQRFVFVIVLMIPFEIRDLNYDSLKLATIPQQIGVKRTKIISVLLLMVFFFLEFFKDEINAYHIIILLIVTFISLLFLVFAKQNQGRYYSSFWVEGIPVFWLILMMLFF
ncbi:UbiA prenyltransferase family protein [Xanthomarina spongicola]|uniref:UbiA prenyltransferase family protein n=1 Tax=Xanthomarina spongicola TaxID=570520 RepID=A0A316DN87_9FLAO|nr:hypothetical protein [Xanthomarina spongicola]PWK19226.1 hypothetical protein LX78_01707 [Xanthomarina spongicola]